MYSAVFFFVEYLTEEGQRRPTKAEEGQKRPKEVEEGRRKPKKAETCGRFMTCLYMVVFNYSTVVIV